VTIRRAGAEDHADWLALWRDWQVHMSGAVPEEVTQKSWSRIIAPDSGLFCLLAREDGQTVGFANVSETPFAWTGGPILFLQDLYVVPGRRGQGIGAGLLQAVYDEADAIGARQVFWMVDEDDAGLQAFYARQGVRSPYLRFLRSDWPW
jgi:GNAT superfamily N-acetyltransferase